MFFKMIAPMVIACTFLCSILIAYKIKGKDIVTVDGSFAIIGTLLGVIITIMNIKYSNNYLITIGPLFILTSLLYLRWRDKLILNDSNIKYKLDNKTLKLVKTAFWICILISLLSYQYSNLYQRSSIFFIAVSFSVMFLGVEIISVRDKKNIKLLVVLSKIFLISLILRFSAYFISPYPIGSDPWEHAGLIKDITMYATFYFPETHQYYSNYPIMHLYVSAVSILTSLNLKESLFIIGTIMVISTIFVFLIARDITDNINVALLSTLIINFSDAHIRWSIQTIAMSFGVVLYTILLFIIIREENKSPKYKIILILFSSLIIWTHTISSFIFFVSVISLYICKKVYNYIINSDEKNKNLTISITFIILFVILLIRQWMDPNYPFYEAITKGIIESLSKEAEFLGRESITNIEETWSSIINIGGFLIMAFFGIFGSLTNLSKYNRNNIKVPLILMLSVLFFIFFAFPTMGINNIVADRWPAFIYITFSIFTCIGITKTINMIDNKKYYMVSLALILVVYSFFMITNSITNMDSPIYGEQINQKTIWTESEINLFKGVNSTYNGVIISDRESQVRPFKTYLKRNKNIGYYPFTLEGSPNWSSMNKGMVIWRKSSLVRPVQVYAQTSSSPLMNLGESFEETLNNNFSAVYDTGLAKAYIGNSQ